MVPFISEIVNNIVLQIIDKVEELDNCTTSTQMANLKILSPPHSESVWSWEAMN